MKYKRMHGFIEFDDERVPVLLYLGGDNKVSKHLDYIWSTNIIILLVWFKWQLALTVHVYSFRSAPILHVLLTMHNSRDKMIYQGIESWQLSASTSHTCKH